MVDNNCYVLYVHFFETGYPGVALAGLELYVDKADLELTGIHLSAS